MPASGISTRAFPRALAIVAGLLLVARLGTGFYEARHPPTPPNLVKWRSLEGAEDEARSANKPILYLFSAAGDETSRKLEIEVFGQAEVADFVNAQFIPVRVRDPGAGDAGQDLREKYGASQVPTLVVAVDGSEAGRLQGYDGKVPVLAFLSGGWKGGGDPSGQLRLRLPEPSLGLDRQRLVP